jgi:acyl-CoA thioester hydrolase
VKLDLPSPFILHVQTTDADVDAFGHVNNLRYLQWVERCAWAHSEAVGVPVALCQAIGRGMAVARQEIGYLRPADAGETLEVADWVVAAGRLRATRRFRIRRGETLLAWAEVDYACIDLATGRPARMPPEFAPYRVEPEVAAALAEA